MADQKKKRKWDVAGPDENPEDPTMQATMAARKLNAMLAASGVAPSI